MVIFVKEFLGVDISKMYFDEALKKYEEAKVVREIRVNMYAEAFGKAFPL